MANVVQDASRGSTVTGSLTRTLSGFANWAMTWAGVGATAGIFSLFGFSLGASGPVFFWGWIGVSLALLAVCLMWAELSSKYPYAGVMYKWPTYLVGRRVGWWVGWTYAFAIIFVLTAYYYVLPVVAIPLFHLSDTTATKVVISLVALFTAAGFNIAGVRILGKFTEIAVIAELIVIFIIATLVLIFGADHGPGVLLQTAGTAPTSSKWIAGFLGGGILMALWVQYGFENGGQIAEETIDAPRKAPRGILMGLAAVVAVGTWILLCFLLAIPGNPATFVTKSAAPMQDIINAALPHVFSTIFLVLLVFVVFSGANVFFMAAVRQVFSMAR